MDIATAIQNICKIYNEYRKEVQTNESSSRYYLIDLFMRDVLEFDPHNPQDVRHEQPTDSVKKHPRKIEYTLLKDKKPVMLIEAKNSKLDLNEEHWGHLFQYFAASDARIGILTNGFDYQFYSALEEPNKMDKKPFLRFSIDSIDSHAIEILSNFSKSVFDKVKIRALAEELKTIDIIKTYLNKQLENPTVDFVKTISSHLKSETKIKTQADGLKKNIRKALKQLLDRKNTDKTYDTSDESSGMETVKEEKPTNITLPPNNNPIKGSRKLSKTELEVINLVKEILKEKIDINRLTTKVNPQSLTVLLDGSPKKQICRIQLNHDMTLHFFETYCKSYPSIKDVDKVAKNLLASLDRVMKKI